LGFLYNIGIYLYALAIQLIAPFNPKAKLWVEGRRSWRTRYARGFQKKSKVLWMHCASLGEFEQGRPVLEAFRSVRPDWQIVLTFFSPSGYEIRKNYPYADFVAYLPADTPSNVRDFLKIIQPDAAVFVKYEFWANYLMGLRAQAVKTVLISAIFREDQVFFKPWGGFWRDVLTCFTRIFVQNGASLDLLSQIGLKNLERVGDTRIDRVLELTKQVPSNAVVERFLSKHLGKKVLLAGSTWPKDEAIISGALKSNDWVCVLAPHEPKKANIERLSALLPNALRYSVVQDGAIVQENNRMLLIDNVGILNSLYQYGDMAYIGGGFGKGIHNTLEPAAFGLPICFGPNFQKFAEARHFIEKKGAFCVENIENLANILELMEDRQQRKIASTVVKSYLQHNKGATDAIIGFLL
jgi:3-deoxy-D-manno-octulosonic-acid transferase